MRQGTDTGRDFEAKLIEKEARDAALREEPLREPKGAVERELSAATRGAMH